MLWKPVKQSMLYVTFATSIGSEIKKPKRRKTQWKGIKGEKGKTGTHVCLSAFNLQVSMSHTITRCPS